MNINTKASKIELTDAINRHLEKQFNHITKYLDETGDRTIQMNVEVGKETNHHIHGDIFFIKARCEYSGDFYYAESEKENLLSAIDEAGKNLQREIADRTGKKKDLRLKGESKIKDLMRNFWK